MKRLLTILALALSVTCQQGLAANPKREFRGAWIQAVNHQFEGMPAKVMQQDLSNQLDSLARCGINTILFQVRVEADALYKSQIEPWSAFLTGRQGQAPDEDWDPLQFMVEQCHKRGMEIHAWINPFRAKTASTSKFSSDHMMVTHPERIIPYGDLALFDPGLEENRDYICSVAADIVTRYDIDGLHIDDYFYPYKDGDRKFADDASFKKFNRGIKSRDDWRRDNVNLFVKQLYNTVKSIKPWVRFGISPFGIYRNQSLDYPEGSATSGYENYSGLYADVLLWIENGWLDYCIPQVYWNTGHKAADYSVLVEWWSKHAGDCLMYIGQDVQRTVDGRDPSHPENNQQRNKLNLERIMPNLKGNCFWPARLVVDNVGSYRSVLEQEYHNTPALQPVAKNMSQKAPGKVRKLMVLETVNGPVLFWTAPKAKKELEKARQYVVYRFDKGQIIDLDKPDNILTVTSGTYMELPDLYKDVNSVYVVTALNRLQLESAPVKCKATQKKE